MNRIYRLIWSESLRAFIPAAEITRRRGKRSGSGKALVGALVAGAVSISAHAGSAAPLTAPGTPHAVSSTAVASAAVPSKVLPKVLPTALPTGPKVTVGQVAVTSSGDQMTVTESTSTAAVNWNSFDIGSQASVTFVQPSSSSVVLNRVLSADPSQIFGSLNANGIIFLINAQGVVVGKGAEVNVGGLVASTLNLSDQDLLAGNWNFTGSSTGTVSNAGSIRVTPGGFAALLGAKVDNTGSISAKLGSVALASGNQVTLDFDDSGLLKVAVSQAAIDALVSNSGAILADGGRIILTAKSADQLLGTVVNNSGLLQAQSIGVRDGQVWLLAADEVANTGANGAAANGGQVHDAAGGVVSSGTIDVSGSGAGQVTLAGTSVDLSGTINAGGATGAGSVLINSTQSTTLEAGSLIDVSSGAAAGKAVVWSDSATQAMGSIDGRGIGASGVGATVEVSSAHDLSFDATVKLGASTAANAGTLILDPATLEIAPGSGMAPDTVYQSVLQNQSGNIVLSATGQITVDVLTNNVLDLANASSLSITSQNSGGVTFLNNGAGVPSGITTHGAPVTLTAAGSGAIDNVGTITTNGGDINLSGVFVHLAGGLDATNGQNAAGNVNLSVFGGAILSSSASPIAGAEVTLDATYGYIGSASAPVPTATGDLNVKTGGNAFVANLSALDTLTLTSNHLEGTPVAIDITASNLALTGADVIGDGTMYSNAVRSTEYSANNPSNSLAGPASVTIIEDGNLSAGNINVPQTALSLTSSQGYILGGNSQPVIASSLNLASPLGIGGTDYNGLKAETDQGSGGDPLLIQAGTVTANVLDPSGNVTGIVNLSQIGDLVGSVQASSVLLQATVNIGESGQPFAVNTSWYGTVYNAAAGQDMYLDAQFLGTLNLQNIQAGGKLTAQATTQNGWNVTVGQATAGNDLSLSGTQFNYLQVASATSTNGSIAITNDRTLEVDAATLNGTDAPNRSITLTSNYSNLAYGLISTNGPTGSAAASAPVGSITINALQGTIYDLAAWEDPPPSVLRAGNATLNALYGINMNNTSVDTYTNLTLNAGLPGSGYGSIYANLVGIDSVNDPNGNSAHSIHVAGADSHNGNVTINNNNGDLDIGSVRSYYDCGDGCSESGSIYLYASGSILADGSIGGGRIASEDLDGNGGYISLNAGGSLGLRGTGADGTTGAVYLSLGGNSFDLTTSGDLFANNDQTQISQLNLNLDYASSPTPYFYHFTSANAADVLNNTPGMTFNGGSSGGLLTVSSATIADYSGHMNLNADGDIEVQSWQSGAGISLGIYGQTITLDAPTNNTAALSMGDSSSLQIQAQKGLTVGSLASTGSNPGDSAVDLEAYNGNLTLGVIGAGNANVNVYATGGDILGTTGNQLLANNLTLTNTFGAIGADPTTSGSIPITIGVAQNLTLTNEGGGGSINLVTLNDPSSLNLTLNTPNSPYYAGANFLMAPATTGFGFSGSATHGAVTLATLGTTGTNPAAMPLTLTVDTPSISINSGSGAQLGIGYDLYFGNSYQDVVANLAGSAGQTVNVHLNNSSSALTSLTGTLDLTGLLIDEALYSGHHPVSADFTLGGAMNAFTLVRTGNDNDPTSFNGSSFSMSGSGQSFSAVETSGTNGSAPGVMAVNASSVSALDLNVNLQTAGLISVGTIDLGALGTVNLSTHVNSAPFSGLSTGIVGVDGSNSITAANINLNAIGNYAGQATIGSSTVAVNVNSPEVTLTTTGDLYLTTGSSLSSLALTVSHPYQDTNGHFNATSENYVYQIGGSTTLTGTDDAANTATALSVSSATPVNFTFNTDRTIDVGTINVGAGNVTLNTNGNWTGWPYYDYTHIGIEQGSGSGITAGSVTLNANGYQGHAGTDGTALEVATADLIVNLNGGLNIADSVALNSLSLTLTHSYDYQYGWYDHGYAVSAPNIALTLVDQQQNGWGAVALENLVSSTLQTFTLNTDANLAVGNYGGNFSGGQISMGSSATVNLNSTGSIWAQTGGGGYTLSDAASSAAPDGAVAIKVGTLNLNSSGSITFSTYGCAAECDSLPVEVANLTVASGGSTFVQNVGNLNVVSANIGGSGYFRAVEAAPSISASITGGSLATPLSAGDLTLVAFYGDIGSSAAPVVTNTSTLTLESGADIYAANQQQLASLSINSDHHKDSIGDTSNGGLNTIVVSDTGGQGNGPLQLGITDLGATGGGYQLTGLNAPQLNFSFETDDGISVGAVTANSVTLLSDTGSILHIPGEGTITAGAVSLQVTTGQSLGAAGESILIDSPNLTLTTGGNLYVADSSDISSLRFNIGSVTDLGTMPVYQLDNSAAPDPLTFNVTADLVNDILDVNSIIVTRTDAPVNLTLYSLGSGLGVAQISDNAVPGGEVDVWSDSWHNVFSLGATPAGISASTVSLMARYGSIGTDPSGNAAPMVVTADTVDALTSGDLRISSLQTIANLTLQNYNSNPQSSGVWTITTPDFALNGTLGVGGPLDVATVTGATTNLEVDSASAITIGTLALGSGSLTLNTNYYAWNSINSDGSNGNTANITTTGNVNLSALTGVGNTAQITTDIAGNVNLYTESGGFNIDQISTRDLILSGVNDNAGYGNSPISITAAGNMTFANGLNGGNNSNSQVTLIAGGDINFPGQLSMNGGAITLAAGGSINGSNIWNSSSDTLTAAGTAQGSAGTISIGSINGAWWDGAGGAITLQAVGDVNIYGQMVSNNSVTITSTDGSIYSQSGNTFSRTPTITLSAAGDIGTGSSGAVGQWQLNGWYYDTPGTLTLSAEAGGQINLLSYAAVNATRLTGGGNVSLQVLGDPWHSGNIPLSFGQVSSATGSVYLGTANGNITAMSGASAITAATSITLDAAQNEYSYATGNVLGQAFNIGSSGTPLSLTAPQISLPANGHICARVPTTGLTDLSVARTYVPKDNNHPGNQTVLMPTSTVLITDVAADTVLDVVDGGWASGNVSAISASYGTALNLSYAGNNAIQLGAITLNGGNLALQATSPSDISITTTGALISANNFSFNLIDANGWDGTNGTASGGFGTALNPINTAITSLSGTTVGATAGVFMNQAGAITFTNLTTGGDIAVTTTRVTGAQTANADILIGSVTSNGGSVSFTADGAIVAANGVSSPSIAAHGPSNDGGVTLNAAAGVTLPGASFVSNSGDIDISATAGGVALGSSSFNAYGGSINVGATAGGVDLGSSSLYANGNIGVSATAGGVQMASSNVHANGNLTVSATAGGVELISSSLYANGDMAITATAGGIEAASSNLNSGYGSIYVHALDTGIDLTGSFVQAGNGGALIALSADQGDVTFGSINTNGNVSITANTGAINGTVAAQNLTGQFNGIIAGANIALNAATGIGTAENPLSINTYGYYGNTLIANTTGTGANINLMTGSVNPGGQAVLEASAGGGITLANYYNVMTLDNVQSAGDINVTDLNYYSQILLNNVTATGPGATFTFLAPYGNIASTGTGGAVTASRIVLNALGDASGGTLGQNYSPVNVNADVVIAVASGDIALNSVAMGPTKMPLVASNGVAPRVSITSTGDFLVGQIVAGQQGTVNLTSAGNIYDDGDTTTQIYAGTVNLTAADAIGTALTPISTTATAYDDSGNVLPGIISAASTTLGNIYLNQTGDAILQSLTTNNGSINVAINDAAHGQSTLVFADTTATDSAGNDINLTIDNGDVTVGVARAGMTAGTVNLNATAGSIYGDGRSDCCTNPNVSGNSVNLTAQNNIGSISDMATLSGTAVGILANSSNVTTFANGSQINLQYVGDVTLGAGSTQTVSPLGRLGGNVQVLLAACGNLTLTGLDMTGVSLGLNAGTGGNGGSVIDGINGGASRGTLDVTAASLTFGAATNIGNPADALWVNAASLNAGATNGGVWINDAATAPVTLGSVTTSGGAVVIGSQGDLLVNSVNAGSGSATLNSAAGSVLDGINGGSNAGNPNVVAGAVTVNAANNAGGPANALWVNASTINASATSGGVWINDAATTPVTVSSVTTGGGAVVIGSQGDLAVQAVNAGSGSATLNSATGSVLDGINGGSSVGTPNVVAGSVTVNAANNAGDPADALWVNAATINASAGNGGVWINDAASAPVTASSVTAGAGPVVIGAQGDLAIGSVNAGAFGATLISATGAVTDGSNGTANALNPNITAAAVTIDSATHTGAAGDALWVNATTVTAAATNGGVWINDASSSTATVSVIAGGPVVLANQGSVSITQIDAGSNSVSLDSVSGSFLDGQETGSSANRPNVMASAVSLDAGTQVGSANGALWVNAASISAAAANGGVRINDAATTPVTLASVTSNAGPVVINGQGDLNVQSINAGSGSVTLNAATGAVLDGTIGGSSAAAVNITAGTLTVNAASNVGGASDALWVNAPTINATAMSGGVWINDASTSASSVAANVGTGPVVIGTHGDLLLNTNATSVSADATHGGVQINDTATTPVTVASVIAGNGAVMIGTEGTLLIGSVNAGSGSATLNSATGAVLDGTGGSSAAHPNVTAANVTVNSATDGGNASDALWVNAAIINATATAGGVWINDAATTPVTVTSITAGNGPVVIGAQGNLSVGTVNAGSDSATLNSATGAVLDGTVGGSNMDHPNVIASAVTVNSATNGGNPADALWVDAATINATATSGGVWINDAATTPVTLALVTAGNGPVVIGTQGNLLVGTVNAGSDSATLNSATGAVLDGLEGGSSATNPNVTAGAVTVNSATDGGNPADPLWVNAGTINASAAAGGVWINDAATTPVTVASVTAGAGPVIIDAEGDMRIGKINAGSSAVSLTSDAGAILDGISGRASTQNPNVIGGQVTLSAANGVGSIYDRVYIQAASIDASAVTGQQFINTPPTPYPAIPLVEGVSPVTVYSAYAQAQIQPPQQLPITLIGLPLRMAPPIEVTADLFGLALPAGVDSDAAQQDATMDTATKPIFGGNDEEVGRKKTLRLKKKPTTQSRRQPAPQTQWKG